MIHSRLLRKPDLLGAALLTHARRVFQTLAPAASAALGNTADEILAFLLLKDGGTVSEMQKMFDTDRRAVVDRLHALGWIEPRGRKGEATVWTIAGPCLAHFGARSAAELKEAIAGQLPQR